MTEAPDYSICDLAQKYADMYSERPSGHLATHHSECMSDDLLRSLQSHN